jgi:2-methylcitrate dehydratase PrpD
MAGTAATELRRAFADIESELRPKGDALTATLAAFVAETNAADIPELVWRNAKVVIYDTIGVALAATRHEVGDLITRYAIDAGPAPAVSTIIGSGGARVSPEMAALANGTLANALDFNESSHIATHVLPPLLALGERDGKSGREILEAFVIGFEAGVKFAEVFDGARAGQQGPTYRGWWHVGLSGPIAAAMACGRLLKLNRHEIAHAIGIASASCGGFRRNMGAMAKPLHSGNAARAGIQAALLARAGFTADPEILEAPLGFMDAVCMAGESDPAPVMQRLGKPYALETAPRIKPYPSCARAHPGLDAVLALQVENDVSDSDIVRIEADLEFFSLLRLVPDDENEAGFSAPFLFAAAIVNRGLGVEQITKETIADARVQSLMTRIEHKPGKHVVMHLRDGRRIERPTSGLGMARIRRLTAETDILAKYHACADPVIGPEAADALRHKIEAIDAAPTITDIMKLAGENRARGKH